MTDETHTYAVYNYYNMTWLNGPNARCNDETGGSDNRPNCFPAQVRDFATPIGFISQGCKCQKNEYMTPVGVCWYTSVLATLLAR